MSEQSADLLAEGQAWAQRQEKAFSEWVTRYGGADPDRWDFGLDSLDLLSYAVFDHCPTGDAVRDPANDEFAEPASWYLGELVRRSDPEKQRWSRRDHGMDAGHYVIEPTAKTRAWEAIAPRTYLGIVARDGDPLWLRQRFVEYVAPLWDKPWPAYTHTSETGPWSWDEETQRWYSQRDRWLNSIAGLLPGLGVHLPDTTLDYSTASLEAVEAFAVDNPAALEDNVHNGIMAYVGECLLRSGGSYWIWDENPESLTNGFPVVKRDFMAASPAHLIEYARARRDGQTFARIHRSWIADAAERRQRDDEQALFREPTPGLDVVPDTSNVGERWARVRQSRFPAWVARYGTGQQWDFSAKSLDALAEVILEHCPAGVYCLDAPVPVDFIDGVVWYFGETLRRAKPSYWSYAGAVSERIGRESTGLEISSRLAFDPVSSTVFLVQELNRVVQPTSHLHTSPIDSEALRYSYDLWVTSAIGERIEQSRKRREQLKRRSGRRRSDEEVLASWLAAREDEFARWSTGFGAGMEWDFSIDSLETLETLIRRRASGPEELLEDKCNADFVDGAGWYFGEVLRAVDPDHFRWEYERDYHSEPTLKWHTTTEVIGQLGAVYTKDNGYLRSYYEWGRNLKRN